MTTLNFSEESRTVEQLTAVMLKEQDDLIKANIENIPSLLEEKSQLVQQLSRLTHQRYQQLSALGFQASEDGMLAWEKSNKDLSLNSAWTNLRLSLEKTRELNRLNGLLINKHLTRNQQALQALQVNSGTPNLYGPNGQTTTHSQLRSHIIG
jgi:flagella synthesis protein FlgN